MFFNNALEAHIKGSSKYPDINGTVHFKKEKNGVLMTVNIKGLPRSKSHCVR